MARLLEEGYLAFTASNLVNNAAQIQLVSADGALVLVQTFSRIGRGC